MLFFLILVKNIYVEEKEKTNKKKKALLVGGGGLVGFFGGFFGGGGGMLAVPLLTKAVKMEAKKAHATSMGIILPMCMAAAVSYIIKGHVEFSPTLFSGIGVVIGGIIGSLLLKRLKSVIISVIFIFLMLGVGIYLIVI